MVVVVFNISCCWKCLFLSLRSHRVSSCGVHSVVQKQHEGGRPTTKCNARRKRANQVCVVCGRLLNNARRTKSEDVKRNLKGVVVHHHNTGNEKRGGLQWVNARLLIDRIVTRSND